MDYELMLDEPWTFLNARGNPVKGRKLTFELADGTMIELDVSLRDYRNKDTLKTKLASEIAAHEDLLTL